MLTPVTLCRTKHVEEAGLIHLESKFKAGLFVRKSCQHQLIIGLVHRLQSLQRAFLSVCIIYIYMGYIHLDFVYNYTNIHMYPHAN